MKEGNMLLMMRVAIVILSIFCIIIGIVVIHDGFVSPDFRWFPLNIHLFYFGPSFITLGLLLYWIARANILKSTISDKVIDMELNILLIGIGLILLFLILSVPIFIMGQESTMVVDFIILPFFILPGFVLTLASSIVLLVRRYLLKDDRIKLIYFSERLRSVEMVIGLSIMAGLLIGIILGLFIGSVTGDIGGLSFLGGIIGLFAGLIIGIRITNK
jgi:hypothetical protein